MNENKKPIKTGAWPVEQHIPSGLVPLGVLLVGLHRGWGYSARLLECSFFGRGCEEFGTNADMRMQRKTPLEGTEL